MEAILTYVFVQPERHEGVGEGGQGSCVQQQIILITQNKLSIFDNQTWIIRAFKRQGQEGAWNGQANTPPYRWAWQEPENGLSKIRKPEIGRHHHLSATAFPTLPFLPNRGYAPSFGQNGPRRTFPWFVSNILQEAILPHPQPQRQADTHTTEIPKPVHPTQAQSTPNHNATPLEEATHRQLTATPKAKNVAQIHAFVAVFQQHINPRPLPSQHEDY